MIQNPAKITEPSDPFIEDLDLYHRLLNERNVRLQDEKDMLIATLMKIREAIDTVIDQLG